MTLSFNGEEKFGKKANLLKSLTVPKCLSALNPKRILHALANAKCL